LALSLELKVSRKNSVWWEPNVGVLFSYEGDMRIYPVRKVKSFIGLGALFNGA
jgi:hypothetical protein